MAAVLDQVLAPGYLDGLSDRPIEQLRTMRAECQEVETGLSLLRRVVQGHLDIVAVEVSRRADGGAPGDRADLLARLPAVLADRTRGTGPGRLSAMLVPAALDPGLEAELGSLAGDGAAFDPSGLDDDGLGGLAEGLAGLEARVSGHRRSLFDRLDAVEGEIARRYRSGETTVDSLLG